MNPATIYAVEDRLTMRKMGKSTAAVSEAREMYLVIPTIMIQSPRRIRAIIGVKETTAPRLVAIPFPPLNFR